MSDEMRDDIKLIRNVAGDLDFGYFDNGKRMRGNIGGPVTRACDRLEAAIQSLPRVTEAELVQIIHSQRVFMVPVEESKAIAKAIAAKFPQIIKEEI